MSCKNKCLSWKNRTKTEICLLIIIVVSICAIAYFGSRFVRKMSDDVDRQKSICMTEKCVHTAATILAKMDKTVDPCDDFYKFVCGSFIKNAVIPDEKAVLTSFSLLNDKVKLQLKKLLDPSHHERDSRPLKLLKTMYKSCLNTTKIEKESVSFVKKEFKELGGWPVTESTWNEKKFDWKSLLYRLRRSGWRHTFFIKMRIEPDLKNSSKRILTITQPDIPYYILKKGFNNTHVQAYYDYLQNLAIFFGAGTLSAAVEMKEVLHFEINLARIIVPRTDRLNASLEYNPMTIKEMQERVHSIPWLQLINNYLAPIEMFTSREVINVGTPQFFQHLENLLLDTKKRILANFMFVKIVRDLVPHLPEKFRTAELEYLKVIQGKSRIEPRWKECLREVDTLHIAASSLYVKNFFNKSDKRRVTELTLDVKRAFLGTLRKVEWMDEDTKKRALLKAEKINSFIAYPDEILDDDKVEEYYSGLQLNPKDYHLKLILNVSQFAHVKYVKTLRQPVSASDWSSQAHSYDVNAFYDQRSNAIELRAAILQDSFFDSERPQYMNYGSIGTVIGHEITHSMDDRGRQYDETGSLVNWWTSETEDIFARRIKCLVQQYNNLTVPELGVALNGGKTLTENVADNGGVKMAYQGYLKWMDRNKEELVLPGLAYTSRQMFWIAAASNVCTKYTKESLEQLVLSGRHSPDYFRVVVPLMNSDDFAKDFNCSLGAPMNPHHKCQVW